MHEKVFCYLLKKGNFVKEENEKGRIPGNPLSFPTLNWGVYIWNSPFAGLDFFAKLQPNVGILSEWEFSFPRNIQRTNQTEPKFHQFPPSS